MRTIVAVSILVCGVWLAAHSPDMAWAALVGGVVAFVVAPGRKSKSKTPRR